MGVSNELVVGARRLTVRMTGVMGKDWVAGSREMFREHLEGCARLDLECLLYDVRDVDMRLGIIELYETGKSLASVPSVGIRVGILARPEQTTPDRFFEKVGQNRGVAIKVCTEERQAEEWLGCEAA